MPSLIDHDSLSVAHQTCQNSTLSFRLVLIIPSYKLRIGLGCTKEAKRPAFWARLKSDFKSGAYDKAKIEYINVLRLGEQSPDPAALARLGQMWLEQGASSEGRGVFGQGARAYS